MANGTTHDRSRTLEHPRHEFLGTPAIHNKHETRAQFARPHRPPITFDSTDPAPRAIGLLAVPISPVEFSTPDFRFLRLPGRGATIEKRKVAAVVWVCIVGRMIGYTRAKTMRRGKYFNMRISQSERQEVEQLRRELERDGTRRSLADTYREAVSQHLGTVQQEASQRAA